MQSVEFHNAEIDDMHRWFINVLRGVAVFLVIYSHCILRFKPYRAYDIFDSRVVQFVCSLNMPLFMLISGYLFHHSFQRRNLQELLKSRVLSLAWPILTFSIIAYYLYNFPGSLLKSHDFDGIMNLLLNDDWLINIRSLWFLWSVMACSVSTAIAFKCFKGVWTLIAMELVIGVIVCCIFPLTTLNIYMLPFFAIGFLCAKHRWMESKVFKCIMLSSLVLFPLMLHFYDRNCFIYTTGIYFSELGIHKSLFIDCFRWLIGFAGSAFCICLLWFVCQLLKKRRNVLMLFERLGIYSLQVYVIQTIVVEKYLPLVRSALSSHSINEWLLNMPLYHIVIIPLMTLLYSIGILLIIRIGELCGVNKYIFGTFLRKSQNSETQP